MSEFESVQRQLEAFGPDMTFEALHGVEVTDAYLENLRGEMSRIRDKRLGEPRSRKTQEGKTEWYYAKEEESPYDFVREGHIFLVTLRKVILTLEVQREGLDQEKVDTMIGVLNGAIVSIETRVDAMASTLVEKHTAEGSEDRERLMDAVHDYSFSPSEEDPALEIKIPEGFDEIALTQEGRNWYRRHQEVVENSRLINGTHFWSPELKQDRDQLERLFMIPVGKGVLMAEFSKLEPAENGYDFQCKIDGETWYVAEMPWYRDQYTQSDHPNGPTQKELVLYKKEDLLTQAVVHVTHQSGKVELDPVALYTKTREALADRENERNRPESIRNYDLPKDRPIGYITLIDGSDDPIVKMINDDAVHFAGRANESGYHFVTPEGQNSTEQIDAGESPKDIIRARLEALRAAGITDVMLNIPGHGFNRAGTGREREVYPDGIYFEVGSGGQYGHGEYEVLTDADIRTIFQAFPEMNFTFKTPACSGAGLAEMMDEYREPPNARFTEGRPRIVMVLESKAFGTNQEGRLTDGSDPRSPEGFSSYYGVHFANAFFEEGLGFGAAHLSADISTKRQIPCDAELWFNQGDGNGTSVSRGWSMGATKSVTFPQE